MRKRGGKGKMRRSRNKDVMWILGLWLVAVIDRKEDARSNNPMKEVLNKNLLKNEGGYRQEHSYKEAIKAHGCVHIWGWIWPAVFYLVQAAVDVLTLWVALMHTSI